MNMNKLLAALIAAAFASVVGVTGLLLASMGIYGTVSYIVVLRTREVGIRMAVGAAQRQVILMVLKQAAVMAAIDGRRASMPSLDDLSSALSAARSLKVGDVPLAGGLHGKRPAHRDTTSRGRAMTTSVRMSRLTLAIVCESRLSRGHLAAEAEARRWRSRCSAECRPSSAGSGRPRHPVVGDRRSM